MQPPTAACPPPRAAEANVLFLLELPDEGGPSLHKLSTARLSWTKEMPVLELPDGRGDSAADLHPVISLPEMRSRRVVTMVEDWDKEGSQDPESDVEVLELPDAEPEEVPVGLPEPASAAVDPTQELQLQESPSLHSAISVRSSLSRRSHRLRAAPSVASDVLPPPPELQPQPSSGRLPPQASLGTSSSLQLHPSIEVQSRSRRRAVAPPRRRAGNEEVLRLMAYAYRDLLGADVEMEDPSEQQLQVSAGAAAAGRKLSAGTAAAPRLPPGPHPPAPVWDACRSG
jgi:hypothetical protein